jgi:hypothetical protein
MLRAACAELDDRDHEYRHMCLGPAGLVLLRANVDRVNKLRRLRSYLARRIHR